MQAMEISRSGLDVEWRRMEVIAQNLANVSSARSSDGTIYRELHLMSGPRASFPSLLKDGVPHDMPSDLSGVAVYGIEAGSTQPRLSYEPANPQADRNGYVAYPAIDTSAQMTLMMKTERAYEANVVALNAARQMYAKALEIGSKS